MAHGLRFEKKNCEIKRFKNLFLRKYIGKASST